MKVWAPGLLLAVLAALALLALAAPAPAATLAASRRYAELAPRYLAAETRAGLPPGLLAAVGHVESRHTLNLVGRDGEQGATQLLPSTAQSHCDLSLDRLRNSPQEGIDCSASLLKFLINSGGSVDYALQAYNCGRGRLASGRDTTRCVRYVAKVKAVWPQYAKPAPDGSVLARETLPEETVGFQQLDSGSELGLRVLRPQRAWGTPAMLKVLRRIGQAMALDHGVSATVVDISSQHGGKLSRHRSHRQGQDADLLLPEQGRHEALRFRRLGPAQLDARLTLDVILAGLTTGHLRVVYLDSQLQQPLVEEARRRGFAPTQLAELFSVVPRTRLHRRRPVVRHWRGHDDHMHLRVAAAVNHRLLRLASPSSRLAAGRMPQAQQGRRARRETRDFGKIRLALSVLERLDEAIK